MNQPPDEPFSQDDQSDQENIPQLDFPPLVDPFAPEAASQPDISRQHTSRQASTPVYAGQQPSSPAHPMPEPALVDVTSKKEPSDVLQTIPSQNGASVSSVSEQPTAVLSTVQPMPPMPRADLPTVHPARPRPQADLPTVPLATVHTPLPLPTLSSAPKKAHKKSGVLVSIVVILALLVAGGGTLFALHLRNTVQSKSTPTAQVSPTAPSAFTPVVTTTGTLNQPLQAGENWVVTVTKVITTTKSDFPPQTGYVYLEISLSLKNVSATPQIVASLLQFTFTDASGKKYNEAAAIEKDTNIHQTPDGTVNSGQTLKAQLSYLVPQSQHTFTLSFDYDLIHGGSSAVTWQLHV